MIDDPALLDRVLRHCTSGDEKLRASQGCVNARRAVDVVTANEQAEQQSIDLEAESARKRAALRRQQELEEQKKQDAVARVEHREAAIAAEELTGSAEYAKELVDDEPETLPPTTPMGAVVEAQIEQSSPGIPEPDVCTIDPGNLSDADLETLLNALQQEWQSRQAHTDSNTQAGSEQSPAGTVDGTANDEKRDDDPASVLGAGGG